MTTVSGVEARWTRYNVLGRADTFELLGRLSSIDSRLGAELSLPHWRQAQQTLRLGGAAWLARGGRWGPSRCGWRCS